MSRISKLTLAALSLAAASLAFVPNRAVAWEDPAPCKPTGCPTGTQLCATVTVGVPGAGSVTFYCYQPGPGGGTGSGPKK